MNFESFSYQNYLHSKKGKGFRKHLINTQSAETMRFEQHTLLFLSFMVGSIVLSVVCFQCSSVCVRCCHNFGKQMVLSMLIVFLGLIRYAM